MAKGKKSSKTQQENYKKYKAEDKWEKNKVRRLKQHCKKFPDDTQAQKALDTANFSYNRNVFKGLKKEEKPVKLKEMTPDERKTVTEQILKLLDNGDIVVNRR